MHHTTEQDPELLAWFDEQLELASGKFEKDLAVAGVGISQRAASPAGTAVEPASPPLGRHGRCVPACRPHRALHAPVRAAVCRWNDLQQLRPPLF